MKRLKKWIALALAVMMLLGLTACAGNNEVEIGDTLDAVENSDLAAVEDAAVPASKMANIIKCTLTGNSFDVSPFGGQSGQRDNFVQNLYAGLAYTPYFGASLEDLQLWLAKEVEKVDDATYTVTLHENIYDNQGNHITADDVVFSYDQCINVSQLTDVANVLDSISKIDDYHLEIKLKTTGNGAIETALGYYRMSIVSQEWYENATDDEKTYNPAVTGAYYIKEYTPGSELVLEAVENYWMPEDIRPQGAKQNVKVIDYVCMTEDAMRSIALENNEVDMSMLTSATELQRFYSNGEAVGDWTVLADGGNMCSVVLLNMDENESVLATNLDLRKAVLTAINSEDIMFAEGNVEGMARVCKTFGTNTMGGYLSKWDEEDYWNYDVDQAKAYLADSGYEPGEITLRFLCLTSVGDAVQSVIIDNLDQIGIKVELLAYDTALYNQYQYDSTQWDVILATKGSTGHITSVWDNVFNPSGYSNGGACFTHDDKLVELLNAAYEGGGEEELDAFHDYLIEIACGKGTYARLKFTVAQSGILELATNASFNPCVNAYVFADDYKSVTES